MFAGGLPDRCADGNSRVSAGRWPSCGVMNARTVWLIAGIALVVRLALLAIVPDAHISSNADNILLGADLIRSGNFVSNPDFPMYMPPLPALFVAAIQSVFGTSLMPVKLIQIAMDTAAVVLLLYAASLMFSGAVAAFAAQV